jgi:ABC-type nickel/cobalt efflux system permease component RcnA
VSSVLLVGFLLGVTHALEVDHLAAMASLAIRAPSAGAALRLGVTWGVGHTLTLFAVGGVVLGFGLGTPERLSVWLELGVAVMLLLLGGDLLRRVVMHRVHLHRHAHSDGRIHVHVHSHAVGGDHDDHPHPQPVTWRALLVGLMHGMAGSAALILLVLTTVDDLLTGLSYIVLFGLGSILGMAALSLVVSLPLQRSPRTLARFRSGLEAAVGAATTGVGFWMLAGSAQGLSA